MKDKLIHEWKDWVLELVEVGEYKLILKSDRVVTRSVMAKNDMDAENLCQVIIRAAQTGT